LLFSAAFSISTNINNPISEISCRAKTVSKDMKQTY
jgi:hypothetical protein